MPKRKKPKCTTQHKLIMPTEVFKQLDLESLRIMLETGGCSSEISLKDIPSTEMTIDVVLEKPNVFLDKIGLPKEEQKHILKAEETLTRYLHGITGQLITRPLQEKEN